MSDDKDIAYPYFYLGSEKDERESKIAGVPIFKDLHMVRIQIPGQRDEVVRPVTDADKQRWPRLWERYERGVAQTPDGVPIGEFATATEAEREALRQLGVQTVEQAAGLGDDVAAKMRIQALKRKASEFLKLRSDLSKTDALNKKIEELERKIKELTNGKNSDATVSGSNASDGVQPAEHVSVEPDARLEKVGRSGKRGRQRTNVAA